MANRAITITFWATIGLAVALLVHIVMGLLVSIGSSETFLPLTKANDWEVYGNFPKYPNFVDRLEIPDAMPASKDLVLWRSWTPEENGTIGTVTTRPFFPPPYIAIPYNGFPSPPHGNRVYFRCDLNGAELDIATLRTNTQLATVFVRIPETFCADQVRLISSATDRGAYIAVGTPFEISSATYFAQTSFAPRATVVFLTWLSSA